MIADNLTAYLLHTRPLKGSTLQAFFLTREAGLVQAFCNGGRSKAKRAVLQPFMPLWLRLHAKHSGVRVEQVETRGAAYVLQGSTLLAGLYLNELLYRALKPESTDARLYEAYTAAIEPLVFAKNKSTLEQTLRRFELCLLNCLGYGVNFSHEARTEEPIQADAFYQFLPKEGFILAHDEAISGALSGAHIQAMHMGQTEDQYILRTMKMITRLAIDDLLDGQVIKTRALYQHPLKP